MPHPLLSNYDNVLPDVTITVLDAIVRLATVPRSSLTATTHAVVKTLLRPRPAFLNLTLNASELSIFAEEQCIEDFVASAACGGSIEVSEGSWSVLQIDEDCLGESSFDIYGLESWC